MGNKKLVLKILAKDIIEADYMDHTTCPITRALYRSGYTNCHDLGRYISGLPIYKSTNKDYRRLVKKLLSMYATKETKEIFYDGKPVKPKPIKDFTITIKY